MHGDARTNIIKNKILVTHINIADYKFSKNKYILDIFYYCRKSEIT